MINREKLNDVLVAYREDFHRKNPALKGKTHWEDERYKWIAVKHFQDNWNLEADDFAAMLEKATDKCYNLLTAQNYFPRGMIIEFAKVDPEAVRKMFRDLFSEEISVVSRVNQFISESERLRKTYGDKEWKSHYQNVNSVSTYLWLRYPEKYYIYKYTEVKDTAETLESDYLVKWGAKPEALLDFFKFYKDLNGLIASNKATTEMVRAALTNDCDQDLKYHTLTIDIGRYISKKYKNHGIVVEAVPKETVYWPSQEEYPLDISKEEWKKYIDEIEIHHIGCMMMLKGMMELGGEASCKKLSSVYGGNPTRYIGSAVNIGKRVKKYFDLPPCIDGDVERFFPLPFQGRPVVEDGVENYSYKIRDELFAALKETDLDSIDPYVVKSEEEAIEPFEEGEAELEKDEHGYWWLNANPRIWSFSELAIGDKQSYTLRNENGNKRRIYQNFLDAKAGEMVIGYESTPVKQVVALARISQEQDGEKICFEKVEGLVNPIDYRTLKECAELRNMEYFSQPQGSLFRLSKEEFNAIMDLVREENPISQAKQKPDPYTKDDFLKEVYMSGDQYDALTSILENKYNLILQGAPGVGKTFAARRLAYAVMGEKDDSRIEFIQFHQNYSYEDFVMGYRPADEGFELKNGIFYRFCSLAANHPEKKYFFIIDEINRGNMSKIFGELLMLIEKDYRGSKAILAYNGMPFSVPMNLYIIGMMNTADRSLAMIDYALRRRFSFFNMKPGFSSPGFQSYQTSLENEELDRLLVEVKELNKVIAKDKSLGSGFCIGHSYFCGHKPDENGAWVRAVVEYDLIPILQEYWFDDTDSVEKWSDRLRGVFHG